MNTLVLGGTRFIGLHLVRELLRRGHEVTVLNRGQSQADLPAEVGRLQADRDDASAMRAALQDNSYDAIFDISGMSQEHVQATIDGIGSRVGHYIYCSGAGVYDRAFFYPLHEDAKLLPEDAAGPWAAYSRNKLAAERLLSDWSLKTSVPYSVIRPSFVYGAGNTNPALESAHFYRLENGRPLLLPHRGAPLVQLVHVEDLAQMFAQCLDNPRSHGQVYNGAGPDYATLHGVLLAFGEAAGIEPQIVRVPDDLARLMQSFPFQTWWNVVFSIEKAIRDLDYSPKYDTRSGLVQSYAWYKRDVSPTFTWDLSEDDSILEQIKSRSGG